MSRSRVRSWQGRCVRGNGFDLSTRQFQVEAWHRQLRLETKRIAARSDWCAGGRLRQAPVFPALPTPLPVRIELGVALRRRTREHARLAGQRLDPALQQGGIIDFQPGVGGAIEAAHPALDLQDATWQRQVELAFARLYVEPGRDPAFDTGGTGVDTQSLEVQRLAAPFTLRRHAVDAQAGHGCGACAAASPQRDIEHDGLVFLRDLGRAVHRCGVEVAVQRSQPHMAYRDTALPGIGSRAPPAFGLNAAATHIEHGFRHAPLDAVESHGCIDTLQRQPLLVPRTGPGVAHVDARQPHGGTWQRGDRAAGNLRLGACVQGAAQHRFRCAGPQAGCVDIGQIGAGADDRLGQPRRDVGPDHSAHRVGGGDSGFGSRRGRT